MVGVFHYAQTDFTAKPSAFVGCNSPKGADGVYEMTPEESWEEYLERQFDNEEFGRLQAEESEWDEFEHVPRPKRKESATRRWITLSDGQRRKGRTARS